MITTSLVVTFGLDPALEGRIKAEVDSRPDGLNKGVTSFTAGDSPGFLVFKDPTVGKLTFFTSEGGINSMGSGSKSVEEWLTIINGKNVSVSYPPAGGVALDRIRTSNSATFNVRNGEIVASIVTVAAIKARYTSAYAAYRLSGASGDGPVVIFITEV